MKRQCHDRRDGRSHRQLLEGAADSVFQRWQASGAWLFLMDLGEYRVRDIRFGFCGAARGLRH